MLSSWSKIGLILHLHEFADDLQIYGHSVSADTQELVTGVTACIERVRCWMASNRLHPNPLRRNSSDSSHHVALPCFLPVPSVYLALRYSLLSPPGISELSSTVICHCQHMSAISPACASTICISYDLPCMTHSTGWVSRSVSRSSYVCWHTSVCTVWHPTTCRASARYWSPFLAILCYVQLTQTNCWSHSPARPALDHVPLGLLVRLPWTTFQLICATRT